MPRVRKVTPRSPRNCEDCGAEYQPAAEGPIPTRCLGCRQAKKRRSVAAKSQRWREANPERQKQHQRESYHRTKDSPVAVAARRRARAKRYGLTPEDVLAMIAEQGNRCAICGEEPHSGPGKRLHVDHCHETGKVRDLLCNNCNHMLGQARENPDFLMAAAMYLIRHQERSEC